MFEKYPRLTWEFRVGSMAMKSIIKKEIPV
jgi:hypothetical protein